MQGFTTDFFLPTWHRGGKCGELLRSPKTSPECGFVAVRLVSSLHGGAAHFRLYTAYYSAYNTNFVGFGNSSLFGR